MHRALSAKLEPAARDAFRAEQVAQIPAWYSPILHLCFPGMVGLALLALAASWLHDVTLLELCLVPAVLLMSNASEWRIHRDLLHKRNRGAEVLYDRHTPVHHRIFITEDMAMRDRREFRLVLIPAYGILLIFLGNLTIVGLLLALRQRNLAALYTLASVSYTLSYEWLHLMYHLPADSALGRLGLVRVLRRHHAMHHDPALMQRWNFNVTIPLWDWVRGTTYQLAAAPAALRDSATAAPAALRDSATAAAERDGQDQEFGITG